MAEGKRKCRELCRDSGNGFVGSRFALLDLDFVHSDMV